MVDGICSAPFTVGTKSLIAGCGFATTLLKVYLIRVFDMMVQWHRGIQLHVFVDDVDVNSTQDTAADAAKVVAKATERLLTEFERLKLRVGGRKGTVLGSHKTVRDQLIQAMSVHPRGRDIPLKA